jgi:hypothetical protein
LGADIARTRDADAVETEKRGNQVLEFRNRLFNWYRLNDYFESGSLTVVGHDDYKVGDPVFLPWREAFRGELWKQSRITTDLFGEGMRYYCVSVSHRWSYGSAFTTTMNLTRGHNEALIDYAKKHIAKEGEHFKNPSMLVATNA